MTDYNAMLKEAKIDYVNTYLKYSEVSWLNIFKKFKLLFKLLELENKIEDIGRRL